MANQIQLDELKKGGRHWSSWRKNYPDRCEYVDFSGANLSDLNLSSANLENADLHGAFLPGANLTDAIMTGAKLRDAYINRVDLSGAKGMTKKQLLQAKEDVSGGITFPNGEKRHTLDGIKEKHLIPRPRPQAGKKPAEPAADKTAHAAQHSSKRHTAEFLAERRERRKHRPHHATASGNGEAVHAELRNGETPDKPAAVAKTESNKLPSSSLFVGVGGDVDKKPLEEGIAPIAENLFRPDPAGGSTSWVGRDIKGPNGQKDPTPER